MVRPAGHLSNCCMQSSMHTPVCQVPLMTLNLIHRPQKPLMHHSQSQNPHVEPASLHMRSSPHHSPSDVHVLYLIYTSLYIYLRYVVYLTTTPELTFIQNVQTMCADLCMGAVTKNFIVLLRAEPAPTGYMDTTCSSLQGTTTQIVANLAAINTLMVQTGLSVAAVVGELHWHIIHLPLVCMPDCCPTWSGHSGACIPAAPCFLLSNV